MSDDAWTARFPAAAADAGIYESYYLKACDPESPRGAWIRYTVLKRPGQAPRGSLWVTLWDGEALPRAHKLTLEAEELSASAQDPIRIGPGRLTRQRATAALTDASWNLEFSGHAEPFPYLPSSVMYRAPVPRTKAISLYPLARFHGRVQVGDDVLEFDDWPGMVGHNWGSEHAERWIWLHGAGFSADPNAWFDAILGRIRVGRLTLPWIANAGLYLDGRLHRLGGPARVRSTRVEERTRECRFALGGSGVSVEGVLSSADPVTPLVWRYSDPRGGEHFSTNCSVASMTLDVVRDGGSPVRLHLPAGAAYELGTRERPAGLEVQAFPDP